MVRGLVVFLALIVASSSSAATLAVLPLRAEGLQLNEANRLNLLLAARSSTRGGFELQDQTLTTQLVEASQALGVDCDVNAVGCAVELGKLADVDFVLIGRAVKLPSLEGPSGNIDPPTVGLNVQLVDVKLGIETRRIIGRVSTDTEQQTSDVDAAAAQLFGAELLPELKLSVTPAGSTVVLNGISLGPAPLPRTSGLLPGNHVIAVASKGYLPWTTTFSIRLGETAQLEVQLVVDPDAEKAVITGGQIAVPFVGAAVGGLAAVVGTALVVAGAQPWFAHEEANAALEKADPNDPLFPDQVATLNAKSETEGANWQSWGLPTTVAGAVTAGIGAVVVAAGVTWGVILLNSDVDGDAAAAP
ncbi:MAG: PEGA domain-containing protein [Deltaproteobacteria bacterium]|nr:PEGA domain-containing protein [Deltaproteobacteria bacterium]